MDNKDELVPKMRPVSTAKNGMGIRWMRKNNDITKEDKERMLLGLEQSATEENPEKNLGMVYDPALYIAAVEPFDIIPVAGPVYRRFPKPDKLLQAQNWSPDEKDSVRLAQLCGVNHFSDKQKEQFLFISERLGEKFIDLCITRKYDLDQAEKLAKIGGEPPELTKSETKKWSDKWVAWDQKNTTVSLPDVNFVSGPYDINIDDARFAVVDFETSGFEQDAGARIIEVGIVVVNSSGDVLDRVDTLINNKEAVHADGADKVHQINLEDLDKAPSLNEVYPDIARALNGSVIVAQNKSFEESHLSAELARTIDGKYAFPAMCTVDLARRFVGDKTPNHKLGTMAEHFNVDLGDRAHMAIADVEATAQMLVGYLKHAKANGRNKLYSYVPLCSDLPAEPSQGQHRHVSWSTVRNSRPHLRRS